MEQMLEEKLKRETLQPKQSAAAPYHEKGGRVWYRSFSRICPPLCVPSAAWFLCPRTPPSRMLPGFCVRAHHHHAMLAVPRAPGSAMHCPILMIYVPPCDMVLLCTWAFSSSQFIWSISSSLSGSLSGAFPPVNWSISSSQLEHFLQALLEHFRGERQVITRPSRRHRRWETNKGRNGAHNSTQTARTLLSRHARGAHAMLSPRQKVSARTRLNAAPRAHFPASSAAYTPHATSPTRTLTPRLRAAQTQQFNPPPCVPRG